MESPLVPTSKVDVRPEEVWHRPIGYRSNLLCHCRQSTWGVGGGLDFQSGMERKDCAVNSRDRIGVRMRPTEVRPV